MKPNALLVWWLVGGTVLMTLTGCMSSRKMLQSEIELTTIEEIKVNDQPDFTEIVITGDRPLIYTSYELSSPQRLVVDLAGATVSQFPDVIPVGQGAVIDILLIEGEEPSHVARLEINLSGSVTSRVRAEGLSLIIGVDKPIDAMAEDMGQEDFLFPSGLSEETIPISEGETEEGLLPMDELMDGASPVSGEETEEEQIPEDEFIALELPQLVDDQEAAEIPAAQRDDLPRAEKVLKITYVLGDDSIDLLISGDGLLEADIFMVGKDRLVVDIPDAVSMVRPNRIPVDHSLVKRIRIGQHVQPKKVRVVLDLNEKVFYTVDTGGSEIALMLMAVESEPEPETMAKSEPFPLEAEEAADAPPPTEPLSAEAEVPVEIVQEMEVPVEAVAVRPAEKKVIERAPAPAAAPIIETDITPVKKYTGQKISLDFQDAEISNIIRLLADVSGFNIVIGEEVKGKVTLKLINVPWDQALDIVLKMRNLGQVREGNIIQVASMATIARQQDDEARAKEAKIKAEDLKTRVIYVNYAKAEQLSETVKKNLSPRGDITIDERTNTMIVKDVQKNLDDILALVKTLDSRTPQVQIEARIVQADTSFARSLGIQWGIGFSAINSNNIFGIQGINTAKTVKLQQDFGEFSPDFAVNIPGSVSGLTAIPSLGFNFGRFTGNPINLDLRLSAGELNGLTKTISSPKITTLDNVTAKIEQGESIPFQTTSLQGTQTTFIDANLTLEVTPHITSDNSIIMKVKAARNSLGSFSGPAGPSISKREASTEVLVKDGETIVIGGIFVDENSNTQTGIPYLSKIPILGWLFKSETKIDTKNELLIFLTPMIIRE